MQDKLWKIPNKKYNYLKMSVKKRLREFLISEKMTVRAFEQSIDAANSYVNSISNSIGLKKLEKIVEVYPNLSLDWLLIGTGEMYREKSNVEYLKKPDNSNEFVANEPGYSYQNLKDTIEALKQTISTQQKMIEMLTKELENKA